MSKPPNFILFIVDQMRLDHLGCYGNGVVRTAAIDALAARGTRFTRFYVTNPACMPNRAALMTGRTSSVNGVRSNGIPLSLQATTFVDLLRAQGWQTAAVGKIHLQNMTSWGPVGRALDHGGLRPPPDALREASHDIRTGPLYEQETAAAWKDPDHDLKLPYYGFEHVDLTAMHSDMVHGHYSRWLEAKHPGSAALLGPENALPFDGISDFQAWRTRVPEELYSTAYIRDHAEAFLHRRAGGEDHRPFFLQCSFNDPHHPFTPPGRYFDMYDPADIELPPSFHAKGNEIPDPVRVLRDARDSGAQNRESWVAQAVNEADVRQAIALTYGAVTMIDDAIARVMQVLEETAQDRDTVVMFTSDHGDFMGDHQLILKGPMHYDGLVRVPFIYVDPMQEAQEARSATLSSTIDIAATVLDRAGLAPFNGLQGQSLTGHAAGTAEDRTQVLVEEDNQRAFLGFDEPVRLRSLITDRHRLSVYRGAAWGELYDLQEDPLEVRNLWNDPGHAALRAELTERLLQQALRLQDTSPMATGQA
ncbi:MAG: sulfatase-like hydrolase/transferase [Pseudomonadota bacterium]